MTSNSLTKTYLYFRFAFATGWRQILFETEFTVKLMVLLNETDIVKGTTAIWCGADEMIWTPNTTKCGYKWSSE